MTADAMTHIVCVALGIVSYILLERAERESRRATELMLEAVALMRDMRTLHDIDTKRHDRVDRLLDNVDAMLEEEGRRE